MPEFESDTPSRDLDADLALCNDTAPLPWEVIKGSINDGDVVNAPCPCCGPIATCHYFGGESHAEFFVAAREGWPWAIKEILRLRHNLDGLLARIFRDGGHALAERYGNDRVLACEDAHRIIAHLLAASDEKESHP